MNVPIYEPHDQVNAPGVPTPSIQPITPAASSAGISEAQAGIGKAVEEVGSRLEQHMVMQAKIKSHQEVYDRASAYNSKLQDMAYSMDPKNPGFLTRKGMNAQGALADFDSKIKGLPEQQAQYDPDKGYGPELVKGPQPAVAPLKKEFMEGLSTSQQSQLDRLIDSHTNVYRGAIIKHEVKEVGDAQDASFKSLIDKQIQLGSAVKDVQGLKAGTDAFAQLFAGPLWKSKGHPENVTNNVVQEHVNEFTKNAVEANVKDNWKEAQKLLDKSQASPDAKVNMQNTINGARIGQYTESLSKDVLRHGELVDPRTGTIDEGKAMRYVDSQIAKQKGLPPGHEETIINGVRSRISHTNGDIKKTQDESAKAFLDMFSAERMANPKANFSDIEQRAISQYGGSLEPHSLDKLRDSASKTWLGDPDGPKLRLNLMMTNPDLKRGYEDARTIIDDTYKGKANVEKKKLAIQHLDETAPTLKSGKEINDWQAEQLSKVKIPGIFGMALGGKAIRRTEEEDALRSRMGDQEHLDAARKSLANKLGRAPTAAETESAVAAFKKAQEKYAKDHANK